MQDHQPSEAGRNLVLPVIHYLDDATLFEQAALASAAGADGVFLISHHGDDAALLEPAVKLKNMYPDLLIGLNLLNTEVLRALHLAMDAGADMLWVDAPGVSGHCATELGYAVATTLEEIERPFLFFGSVAFKYQKPEPDPAGAAVRAASLGMLPTTSGSATGHAPALEKIRAMHAALAAAGRPALALASGLTPENVADYAPYASHLLVATGISVDEHRFDRARLAEFIRAVRACAAPDAALRRRPGTSAGH